MYKKVIYLFLSSGNSMERLYWGILSAGKISHDFVNALNDPSGPALANNKVHMSSTCSLVVATRVIRRSRIK